MCLCLSRIHDICARLSHVFSPWKALLLNDSEELRQWGKKRRSFPPPAGQPWLQHLQFGVPDDNEYHWISTTSTTSTLQRWTWKLGPCWKGSTEKQLVPSWSVVDWSYSLTPFLEAILELIGFWTTEASQPPLPNHCLISNPKVQRNTHGWSTLPPPKRTPLGNKHWCLFVDPKSTYPTLRSPPFRKKCSTQP